MAKVTFIPEEKIISVNLGVRILDVQYDIYSDWKRWVVENEYNMRFPIAIRTVGGDNLVDGKTLGATFFLMNGWKIRPPEENGNLNVIGNLYDDGGGAVFVNTLGSYNSMIIQTVSNLTDSQLVESTLAESLNYNSVVYYDSNSTYSGTVYPLGTVNYPVNNIDDAVAICNNIGSRRINLNGDIQMTRNFEGYNFYGISSKNTIYCNGYDFSSCSFDNVTITGSVTGQIRANSCSIYNCYGISGDFNSCALSGVIKLGNNDSCFMLCFSKNKLEECAYLDGSNLITSNVDIRAYSGCVYIDNFNSDNINLNMDFISGGVYISASVTAVDMAIRGMVVFKNFSNVVPKESVIINPESITDTIFNTNMSAYSDANTFGGFVKNKLLTVAKFIGLK